MFLASLFKAFDIIHYLSYRYLLTTKQKIKHTEQKRLTFQNGVVSSSFGHRARQDCGSVSSVYIFLYVVHIRILCDEVIGSNGLM